MALTGAFVILNALRIGSILSLLSSIVAAIAILIKSFTVSKFFLFDALSQLILVGISGFLVISDLSLAKNYLARNWPVFACNASLLWQGISEICIGCFLLGTLNEDFASRKNLGDKLYGLLVASGVLVCCVGVLNILAAICYRCGATARERRAWKRRRKGGAAEGQRGVGVSEPIIRDDVELKTPERSYSVPSRGSSWGMPVRSSSVYSAATRDPRYMV